MTNWTDRRFNGLIFLALGALVYACSDGGSGCDIGCGDEGSDGPAYEFAGSVDEHVVHQAAQIHVTQSGLDRISGNLDAIIGTLLGGEGEGGGLSFCLPETDVTVADLCGGGNRCNDGTVGCELEVGLGDVRVIPTRTADPSSDYIKIELDLLIDDRISTTGTLSCDVDLDTGEDGAPVAASIYLRVGAPDWERTSIDFPADELEFDVEDIDIDFSGGWLGSCNIADLVTPFITGLLEDQIAGPLEDAIGPLLCQACDTSADCPDTATCSDDVCVDNTTDECLPLALGVEMEIALGEMLADFAPGLEADLGVLAYAANYADAVGPPGSGLAGEGIDLAAQVGFYAEHNGCVPYYPAPPTERVDKSPEINADLTPGGDDFMVGIGVAQSALNLAGWAAYRSGVLCLEVSSDTIPQVSTGTFSVLLPSLGQLVDGDNRPMYLQLRPQRPPTIELGAGTVNEDGTIDEPLLTLKLDDLDIDFYVFTEDRYVRMLTLGTDIAVPLGLDVNEMSQLVVILGDLTEAIQRIEPSNAELLTEADAAAVSTVLPTIIGALVPTLLGEIDPIDIPELTEGISLVIPEGGITSVDGNTMLAIYADLAFGTGEAKAGSLEPMIATMNVARPDAAATRAMLAGVRDGTRTLDAELLGADVTLEMDTFDPSGEAQRFDYSYRINGGAWSQWRRDRTVTIDRSMFLLAGAYEIDVRARVAGTSHTASPVLASTTVVVDYVPPTVAFEDDGTTLSVVAEDLLSDVSARVRVGDGAWRRLPADGVVLARGESGDVTVEATDAFGNTTTATRTVTRALHTQGPASDDAVAPLGTDARGGCSSTTGFGGAFTLLLGLLALLSTRRREVVTVVAASLFVIACGDDNKAGTTDKCDPECAEGESCVEGMCVADAECEVDDDCGEGEMCDAGVCVDEPECTEDVDCDEGYVCEAGACVEDTPTGCETDDDCGDGEYCADDATCQAYECAADSECSCDGTDVAVCDGGFCACEPACGGECGDGSACCLGTNECVDVVATCEPGDCEVGYEIGAVGDPVFNPDTCEVTVDCGCVELDPLAFGYTGAYLDVGVGGGVAAVAAYNATYGDLMVGTLNDDNELDWQYTAGSVTDGAVTGSLNGPRGGIAEKGDDMGEYPSIAVAEDGTLHVAFYASGGDWRRTLLYGYGTPADGGHEWTWMQLDDTRLAGHFTDIELDENGYPVIAYAVPSLRTDEGEFESHVRVMRAGAALPTREDWADPAVIVRYVSPLPCGASCVGSQECRLDINACQSPERDSACEADCGDGACFEVEGGGENTCAAVAETPEGIPVLYEGIGIFLDMEMLPEGALGVTYYDRPNGNLMFATTPLTTLDEATPVVLDGEMVGEDDAVVDTGDVGWFPDLFVTAEGDVLVSYADATYGSLRLIDIAAGESYPVDDGVRCYDYDEESRCIQPLKARVGYDSALAEDEAGLHLVYQDATWHEVLESPLGEFGWDIPGTIATGGEPYTGAYGFYLGHAVGPKGRFVVSYRLNQRATPATRDVAVIPR